MTATDRGERLLALDVARGTALLGIFLVNVHVMADAVGVAVLQVGYLMVLTIYLMRLAVAALVRGWAGLGRFGAFWPMHSVVLAWEVPAKG